MSAAFDASVIEGHGWRQGAVLGPNLATAARKLAPSGIVFADSDWLIVTSHDCDVANWKLEKEPTVEVLRATVVAQKRPDKQQVWGRNPREMHIEASDPSGNPVVLGVKVHDRWPVPRELLASEPPACVLDSKTRRLVAEWLAKRYIRAAFPTAFDARWRTKMKDWTSLLEKHSKWVQGVYVLLNTLDELGDDKAYRITFIIATPASVTKDATWLKKKTEIEGLVEAFWKQFAPGIVFDSVEVISTGKLTLAAIELFQRFDADWVSFADDTPATPHAADMKE